MGFPAFQAEDVTKVEPTKLDFVSHIRRSLINDNATTRFAI